VLSDYGVLDWDQIPDGPSWVSQGNFNDWDFAQMLDFIDPTQVTEDRPQAASLPPW